MYCYHDECAEYSPCLIHNKWDFPISLFKYEYDVESLSTVWSHFTSLSLDCEEEKHNDLFYGSCSHYVDWQPSQPAIVFRSNTIEFAPNPDFWFEEMICFLCQKLISEPEELIVNMTDMCQFHVDCLHYKLQKHTVLETCPGCDTTECRPCWKCDY